MRVDGFFGDKENDVARGFFCITMQKNLKSIFKSDRQRKVALNNSHL